MLDWYVISEFDMSALDTSLKANFISCCMFHIRSPFLFFSMYPFFSEDATPTVELLSKNS